MVRRKREATGRCGYCGGELARGESYWYINGEMLCEDCLPVYARGDYEPFRQVRGEEAGHDAG